MSLTYPLSVENTMPSLSERFNTLADPALWRGLAPALHVGDDRLAASMAQPISFDQHTLAVLNADLLREGYFQLRPLDWGIDVADLAAGVSAVVAAGYQPAFAFMYDEPWFMYARLRTLLAAVLGEDYKMMPAFWAWHVDGVRESAGWTPHRDLGHRSLFPDRRPKSMTFWLPLNEATPLNGCMHILPADRDPFYGTTNDHQTKLEIQDIRALPSAAGGVLAWTQAAFHWGGRARTPVTAPRISISVEFQRGDQPPFFAPLLDPRQMPDPTQRLRLILRQAVQYKHMYPLQPDLQALAEASTSHSGPTQAFMESLKVK